MLDKITLIIPTHNRHHYLTRILEYYSDINLKILVADSSQNEYIFKDKYQIDYFHYPNYMPQKKLADIIQKVKTPYVFMCADDDFIIPNSIEKCIKFLESNSDYSSAQGIYFRFIYGKKNTMFSLMYTSKINYDLNENSVEKRLKRCMKNYMQMVYCVNRTENLKDIFNLPSVDDFTMDELIICVISVINGKHKILSIPYGVREVIKGSAGNTTKRLYLKFRDQEKIDSFNKFIDILSIYYSKKSGISIEKAKKFVKRVIELKILQEIKKKIQVEKQVQKISYPIKKFYNIFINLFLLHQKIKDISIGFFNFILSIRFFNIVFNRKYYFNFENPNSKYFEDFKRIRNYISLYSIYTNSKKAKGK